eukprot:scaffold63092_cov45-Attheya_sp.AAC.1
MNTNEDAYFDHGDTSVPIVEGSLVHFQGGKPHNTVVNSGFVNMLGPFDIMGFKSVGNGNSNSCNNDARCCDEDDCDNVHVYDICVHVCVELPSAFDDCECHAGDDRISRTLEKTNSRDSVLKGIKTTRKLKVGKRSKSSKSSETGGGSCEASCCSGEFGSCDTVFDCCKEMCMDSSFTNAESVRCTSNECRCN